MIFDFEISVGKTSRFDFDSEVNVNARNLVSILFIIVEKSIKNKKKRQKVPKFQGCIKAPNLTEL